MNVLLWVLQALLSLLLFSGGGYKLSKCDELARQFDTLSPGAWGAVGVLEIVGAVLLIVPAAVKWMPLLTPLAAGVLALESLALTALYAQYSLKLTAANPLIWSIAMGLLAAFVAYGRYALRPI